MKVINICGISKSGISVILHKQCFGRNFWASNIHQSFSSSIPFGKKNVQQMQQVEVDEANVKQELGQIQMAFVKKAEMRNKERAKRHVFYRKKDWMIGMTCITIAISIYAYTIFAMKQETFLDDFEMPDPLLEEERRE